MYRDFEILAYFFGSNNSIKIIIRRCTFDGLIYRLFTLGVNQYVILTVDGRIYPDPSLYTVPNLAQLND